jgi:hypothetical protein
VVLGHEEVVWFGWRTDEKFRKDHPLLCRGAQTFFEVPDTFVLE